MAPISGPARCACQGYMESEEEEDGPTENFGVLRLPLKLGSQSGYIGVQKTKSKKRQWQATLKAPGQKRKSIGSFKEPLAS